MKGTTLPAKRLLPSDNVVIAMRDAGMTHQQIADTFHVGRSTVAACLHRAGATNRVRYEDEIPWDSIATQHNHHYALTMLRVRARINRGMDVTEDQERRLASWEARNEAHNAEVVYRKDSEEGFYYVRKANS